MNSSRFISAVLFGLACYLGSFSAFANEQAIEEIIVTARQQSEGFLKMSVVQLRHLPKILTDTTLTT